jgi:hypothetical protein
MFGILNHLIIELTLKTNEIGSENQKRKGGILKTSTKVLSSIPLKKLR